jgi:hypothetical protein
MSNFIIISEKNSIWYRNGSHQVENTNKPVKKDAKVRSAAKAVVSTIYPIFNDISNQTTDNFWKEIFKNFSIGVFRRGFSYSSIKDDINVGLLTYKIRTKEYICYVNGDPQIAFTEVKNFMSNIGGVLSETDKTLNTVEMQSQLSIKLENPVDNWSKIRNNVAKKVLILYFARKYCRENNIPNSEILKLKKLIEYKLMEGGKINIKMKDGFIYEIPSLTYINNVFNIEVPIVKSRTKYNEEDEGEDENEYGESYNKVWSKSYIKFLEDLEKTSAKRNI